MKEKDKTGDKNITQTFQILGLFVFGSKAFQTTAQTANAYLIYHRQDIAFPPIEEEPRWQNSMEVFCVFPPVVI